MKKFFTLLALSLVNLNFLSAQITFGWETATENGNTITETIDGITVTYTGTNDEVSDLFINTPSGYCGSSNKVIWENTLTTLVTFSFDQPVDIISILPMNGNMLSNTYTFTPQEGSSNSPVVVSVVNGCAPTVELNWTNVTSFTVTTPTNNQFGFDNLVVLKYCSESIGIDTRTECNSFTWIDGITYTESNNTATFNIVGGAAYGCDSLVTLDLTINRVTDVTTETAGITISANNTGATYQWLDCDNNYAAVDGATDQTFTPSVNGNYAVQVTENGCVDTSACVAIMSLGILENNFEKVLAIYPNPTAGNFTIDLGDTYESSMVFITDISGRLLDSKTISQSQILNLSINEPAGVYLISIQADDKKAVMRLIKE